MGAMIRVVIASLAVAALFVAPANATAPPVGPLPAGPTTLLSARAGKTFRVALVRPKVAGRVWRIARPYDARIVREVREGETKTQIWLAFRALHAGRTTLVFAQTRGETAHAYAARRFRVTVGR